MWLWTRLLQRVGFIAAGVERGDFGGSAGGIWRWNASTAAGVTAMAGIALAATLVISARRGSLKSPWSRRKRKRPLTRQKWNNLLTPEGKIKDEAKFLKKVRSGGIDPSIRPIVWPFLLGVYDLNSTAEERETIRMRNRKEYNKLRHRCRQLINLNDDASKEFPLESDETSAITTNSEDETLQEAENLVEAKTLERQENLEEAETLEEEAEIPDEAKTQERQETLEEKEETLDKAETLKIEGETFGERKTQAIEETLEETEETQEETKRVDREGTLEEEEETQDENKTLQEKEETQEETKTSENHEETREGSKTLEDKEENQEGTKIIKREEHPEEEEESDLTRANSDSSDGETLENPRLATENYETWQRIIRLDALRANADWIPYSPEQASISPSTAARLAAAAALPDSPHLDPPRLLHASRLVSILEAYALLDPEIGYCQGMSDLLSPIIAVLADDSEAFWCFVGFMRKARHNFRLDEVGIRRQLSLVSKIIKYRDAQLYKHLEKLQAEDCFFVYRMVVVLLRREMSFEQILCLWEVMWADQAAVRVGLGKSGWDRIRQRAPPTEDLLLYAIAACVLQRRKMIIEKYRSMDEILRECNSMAGRLDFWRLLDDAHDLVVALHDKV